MKSSLRHVLWSVFVAAAMILSACSTTEIVGTWKDPQLERPLDSMLVIARVEDESLRRMAEDRFAAALQDRGVNAVASYRVFPQMSELEKGGVEARARKLGLEGILITRVLSREKVEVQEPAYAGGYPYHPYSYRDPFFDWPPYYRSWHGYYGYGYRYPYAPTWSREATVVRLESNVYRSANDGLVWSARTETTTMGNVEKKIDEVAEKVVGQMADANAI